MLAEWEELGGRKEGKGVYLTQVRDVIIIKYFL